VSDIIGTASVTLVKENEAGQCCINPFGVKPLWKHSQGWVSSLLFRQGLIRLRSYTQIMRNKMTDKISGDGAAYVDHDYYWRPLETAPHGVKLQLLSIYGVASHGLLSPAIIEDGFWIGWTPLPKRRKDG
jgi:hypothetical protein